MSGGRFGARPSASASQGLPGDWADEAACRRPGATAIFFPAGGDAAAAASAKRICQQCPAQAPCLEFALTTKQESGVWGGLAEDERRRLQRRREQIGVAS